MSSPFHDGWTLLKSIKSEKSTTVKSGHPMELAFRLLKNYASDNNKTPSSLEQPQVNPLNAALARARNQGPAPSANIQGSRRNTPPPKTIEELLAMLDNQQGSPPMGQMPPSPQ